MKKESVKRISDIVEQFIKEEGLEEGIHTVRILRAYDIVVGDMGAKATIEKNFFKGNLYLKISSGVVRHQLFMKRLSIVKSINELIGVDSVKNIILK